MDQSGYIVRDRESVVEVTPISTNPFSNCQIKAPSITWEQFILLNAEMDRLAMLARTLLVENESLKNKINKQSSLVEENDRLRKELTQAITKAELSNNNSRRFTELETALTYLTQENQHLAHQLTERLNELNQWKAKHDQVEEAATKYNLLYQTAVTDNRKATNELIALKGELATIESLRAQINQGNKDMRSLTMLKDNLNATLIEKEKENANLKQKLATMNGLLDKLASATNEKESLHSILNSRSQEISSLQKEVSELRAKVSQVGDLENKVMLLLVEKERLNQEKDRLYTHISEKRAEAEKLEIKAREARVLESELKQAYGQGDTLKNIVLQKDRENGELKAKLAQIGNVEQRLTLLLVEKERLVEEKERLNALVAMKRDEVEKLSIKAREAEILKDQVKQLDGEKQRLQGVMIEKHRENEGLKKKASAVPSLEGRIDLVEKNKEMLTQMVIEKERVISELNMRLARFDEQLMELSTLKSKVSMFAAEVERLNGVIVEKERCIQDWEAKYDSLEALYVSVKDTTDQLEAVKQRYQEAVMTSERVNPRLRKSVDLHRLKRSTYDSELFVQKQLSTTSTNLTQGSPDISPALRQSRYI